MSIPWCGREARKGVLSACCALTSRGVAAQLVALFALSLPASASDDGAWRIASGFDRASLVVSVRDASALRETDEFSLLLAYIGEVAGPNEIAQSWRALSNSLGWDGGEAFDQLLGSSSAFVLDHREDPDSWIIISEVSRATAARIGERLRVVPKAQVAGIPVLGVEGDSIAGATISLGDKSLLVLTRDRKLESFRRAIRMARELAKQDGVGRMPDGQISVVSRGWPHDGTVISASASQREGGWKIRTAVRAAIALKGLGGDRPRWSAPMDVVRDDVLFEVHTPIALLELDNLETLAIGGQSRDDRPGLDEFGSEISLTARRGRDGVAGGLTLTLAVAVRGVQRSAAKGDAMISAIIARLSAGRIGGADFEGLHPDAMRVSEARGLEPFIADPAIVSWGYARCESGGGWLLIDAASQADAGGAPGRLEWARESAAGGDRERPEAYLTTGWIRPAESLGAMRKDFQESASRSALLETIAWVSWRIWSGEDAEEIHGDFEIELREP